MDRISQAFTAVPREQFLSPELRGDSWQDRPLPIGYGQTNSQPSTVRQMLEWLDPQPGDKVLDIGSGSGWTTALLAYLVGNTGMVYAVEKVAELVNLGKANCIRAGIQNAYFYQAGQQIGLPNHAPYDRILVSAAAKKLPNDLLWQLGKSGRLVIPVQRSIHVITNQGADTFEDKEYTGFVFVPLI